MKKNISIILSIMCILSLVGCGKKEPVGDPPSVSFQATILEINNQTYLVEPVEGSQELKSADQITVPMKNLDPSLEPEIGDIIEIKYNGEIAESYPAQITEVYGIKVVKEASEEVIVSGAPLAPDVSGKDLESVSYIEVMSGLTGQRIKVKDADSVQKVMDDIESLKYEKKNAVEEVGYAYRIRFYNENDDELGRIFITEENGHQISYDGYYYLVEADQNINVNNLEELLVDAPPAEPGDEGNDELPEEEAFVVTNVFTAESKPLLANDGLTIADILGSGSWNTEGTTDCMSNIEITINGTTYKYHSDCGTFNDNVNQQYLSLDDDIKENVNAILAEYISLTATEVPIE